MTELGTPDRPPAVSGPPRSRRRLLPILALVALPVVSFAVWSRVQSQRLDRVLDAIEARGELLNPASFELRPETAEQEEAARLYSEAARLSGSLISARFLPSAKTIDELSMLSRAEAAGDSRLTQLARAEAPLEAALRTVERAAALDAHGARPDERFFPMSSVATVGKVRVARLAFSGEGDAAARALLSILRLRRMSPAWFRPFVDSTRDSLRLLLTFSDPPEPTLDELQREYAALERDLEIGPFLMYWRAEFLRAALPSEFAEPDAATGERTNPLQIAFAALLKPLRASAVRSELKLYQAVLEAARLPWPAKLDAISSELEPSSRSSAESPRRRSWFASIVRPWGASTMPGRRGVVATIADSVAYTRVSIAMLAIARYRAAHDGALPAALHDLVPAYLPAPLMDPYTGRELAYRRGERGTYKVYSAGANRQDDGGTWEGRSDVWANRRETRKDLGIAVGRLPPGR